MPLIEEHQPFRRLATHLDRKNLVGRGLAEGCGEVLDGETDGDERGPGQVDMGEGHGLVPLRIAQADEHAVRAGLGHADARRDQDRKSTRLNSSHSQISYAVFCLKKKKIKNTSTK